MTLSGVGPTSGNSGVQKPDSTEVRQRLADANQTVLDARAKSESENDLQTVEISDSEGVVKTSSTAQIATDEIKTAAESAEEKYNETIKQYYLQIETLQQQLRDIDEQRRSLSMQLSQGGDISQI